MSKRYKDKTCPYCATPEASVTADHVFAREFVPVERRDGLPIVPACERCNNDKSKLEHYLATVLAFGGKHPDAARMLAEIERRLAKNAKLRRELSVGQETVWERQRGLLAPAMRLPFQTAKLEALAAYWARGLALHHFGVVISADCNVIPGALTTAGEAIFGQFLAMNGNRVVECVGDGAFEYEGVQSVQDPHLTIWRFKVYGGVRLAGDPKAPHEDARHIWVTASKSGVFLKLRQMEPA